MIKPETLAPGTRVGPFDILRPINAAGGMATLYLAEVRPRYRRRDMPNRLALKVARAEHEDFLKVEADILSRLRGHPHIVRAYSLPSTEHPIFWTTDSVKIEAGHSERLCFMAMEYVGGGSLRRYLDDRRSLRVYVGLGIARQIADAMAEVHRNTIVHLDLKPENVLFRPRRLNGLRSSVPDVVVCDFGLARDLNKRALTVQAGTKDYMPPELFVERDWNTISRSADVYMLGVLMYEMLVGRLPFDHPGQKLEPNSRARVIEGLKSIVSPDVADIVTRSLEYSPAARFATALDMQEALARVKVGIDGARLVRQAVAGVAAAGVLAGLAVGGKTVLDAVIGATPSPTSTFSPTITATDTRAPSSTATATPYVSTATPVATHTPRPTPVPKTSTPTPRPAP